MAQVPRGTISYTGTLPLHILWHTLPSAPFDPLFCYRTCTYKPKPKAELFTREHRIRSRVCRRTRFALNSIDLLCDVKRGPPWPSP